MALPNKLGISFTSGELTAINDGVTAAIDGIKAKIILNISDSERKSLSKVGNERFPYVAKSIGDYGVNIPAFNPIAWPFADASKDADVFSQMLDLETKVSELQELVEELRMVAGHFCWQFLLEQYASAKRNVGSNISGAQTIVDGLEGAFEGMGNFGPAAPANP